MTIPSVFVDTMLFLHFKPIEEIDWLRLLSVKNVEIVISPIVLRELEIKKSLHEKKRIRDRASAALKKMAVYLDSPTPVTIRDGVRLSFRATDPQIDFPSHRLNDKISDDWLLATVLEFQAEQPDVLAVLLTNDVGLRVKASGRNLRCVALPEEYALPIDADPEQVKIQKLERELVGYRNAVPKLRLEFEDGKTYLPVRLFPMQPIREDEILEKIEGLKAKHPKVSKPERPTASDIMMKALGGVVDYDRYNARVDLFYGSYGRYLRDASKAEDAKRRLFSVDIALANDGSRPAEDIDVHLHFPDGLQISDDVEGLWKEPSEPVAPRGPISDWEEKMQSLSRPLGLGLPALNMPDLSHIEGLGRNVSAATIRRTNSYDIDFKVRALKHCCRVDFDTLYIIFDSWDTAKSFSIDYELHAGNVPNVVTGQLHIAVETAEHT